jgi:CBS domain-containing protein
MLCPICRYENFEGEDTCANCGAPLATVDARPPIAADDDSILGERLSAVELGTPHIVDLTLPVADAIRQMHSTGTDCLLVAEGGRLVGIFTDRDAAVKAADKRLQLYKMRDFMTPDPVTLQLDDTLALAIHKMAVGGFRHIPIVDDGRPIGVIAAADVFRYIVASLD